MANSITEAYKNKEYGWFIAYIAITVISWRLAGIIGGIVSVLVISGLYKTVKNSIFSKKKKFLLSSAYIVGGVVGFLIAFGLLKIVLQKYTDVSIATEPAVKEILNVKHTEQVTTSSSTSTIINNQENSTEAYTNKANNFKINPPKKWTINETVDNIIVEFDDPTPNRLGAITIGSDPNMGKYTLKEYSAGIMQGMIEEGARNVQIVKQGEITLNGISAYSVEFNYNHSLPNGTYPMHALSVSLIHNGTGYAILGVTQQETTDIYEKILEAILSFDLLN